MTSDDEFFFDYLAAVPNQVKKYSHQVADSIDKHVENAAESLRDILSRQNWIPVNVRPRERTISFGPRPSAAPKSCSHRVEDWIRSHQAWAAAAVAFLGTGAVMMYFNMRQSTRKRRAKRAANGARKEIVVIAGSPLDPLARSIASDLERRGYIVFVTCTQSEEEHVVENEAREDIRSLWLDFSNSPSTPSEVHPSLYVIQSLITHPQVPMPGAQPHVCQLSGLIIVPSMNYPSGPVATIPASTWADTINTRLLYPILTAQLFLPLLTMKSNTSTIVLVSGSIQSSLSSPFASPEVAITKALSGFATSLRQELRLLEPTNGGGTGGASANPVNVVEIKLGHIDLGRQFRNGQGGGGQKAGAEVFTWQPHQRALYGPPYLSTIDNQLANAAGFHGTPARQLHIAIFDALAPSPKTWVPGKRKRKSHTVYVGRGSRTYAAVGNFLPSVLIGWMIGLRFGYYSSALDLGYDGEAMSTGPSASGSETGWERLA